jgi:hypothetical protein
MATAATIIARSMRLLSQIGAGATPTTAEYADGLVAVNGLLDAFRNESLMCYATRDESLTLAAADTSYTIGPSGDLNTTRPTDILQAWVTVSGLDYPVRMISDAAYSAIVDKAADGDWPTEANYRPTMSTGTLNVWPAPGAAYTMKLRTQTPLTVFTAITDTVSLPPGWEQALAYNLAVIWAPEFETSPRQEVVEIAMATKAGIKRVNSRPIRASTELSALVGRSSGSIFLG